MSGCYSNPASDQNSRFTVEVLARAHALLGLDIDAAFRDLGVHAPPGQLPQTLDRQTYCAAWEGMGRLVGRADVGVEIARGLPLGSLGALEWAIRSAPTLGDSFRSLARFGRLLHTGGNYAFELDGDVAKFSYRSDAAIAAPPIVDWSFGYLLRIARHDTQLEELPALELRLQYPRPGSTVLLEEHFACPTRFGAPVNELRFARGALTARKLLADEAVHRALLDVISSRLAEATAQNPLEARVRAAVRRMLALGDEPSVRGVAKLSGVGTRTLQRRLGEGGVTFRALVERTRVEEARRILTQPNASVTGAALELGYASPSSLHRAFQKHFGYAPSALLRRA